MDIKMRYAIVETYNGLFDQRKTIAYTVSLFETIKLIEILKKIEEENPCYDYDFKKLTDKVDEAEDFYPGEGFEDFGKVIDCKNYKEFLEKNRSKR